MSAPLPSHPQLSGNYAPIRIECNATDLTVEGDLPPQLHGSLYRVGPNPQYMPKIAFTQLMSHEDSADLPIP